MKETNRILFISQEIFPYLAEENPVRLLNRQLPEMCQSKGFETRIFMPKFGEINERRNQLHEVIRLSGMNLIIDDTDHPLLIKVASIPSARIQVYFIDNDDYFMHRKGTTDDAGVDFKDNDERCIFFARGAIETVKKLRWTPDVIHCSGWMAALVPLYLNKVYRSTPFFEHSKLVVVLDNQEFTTPFPSKFANKLRIEGLLASDVRSIEGFPVGYEELMRLAIDNADAVAIATENVNQRVLSYAQMSGKPILNYVGEDTDKYIDFYSDLVAE